MPHLIEANATLGGTSDVASGILKYSIQATEMWHFIDKQIIQNNEKFS